MRRGSLPSVPHTVATAAAEASTSSFVRISDFHPFLTSPV
jgi:hypothetical protein